jgi:hypothetical protein
LIMASGQNEYLRTREAFFDGNLRTEFENQVHGPDVTVDLRIRVPRVARPRNYSIHLEE